jgi:predicted nucleic acid-binding protein
MVKPKAYIDACCIIEAIKGRRGLPLDHPPAEVEMIETLMRAANDGAIELFTSTITVAEVIHLGEKPPPSDLKSFIERLILSGRNGIIAVAPSPQIVLLARDLAIDEGLWVGVADRLHVATAMSQGITEFYSVDGRLAKRIGNSMIRSLRIITPTAATILPQEYKTNDLFKNAATREGKA